MLRICSRIFRNILDILEIPNIEIFHIFQIFQIPESPKNLEYLGRRTFSRVSRVGSSRMKTPNLPPLGLVAHLDSPLLWVARLDYPGPPPRNSAGVLLQHDLCQMNKLKPNLQLRALRVPLQWLYVHEVCMLKYCHMSPETGGTCVIFIPHIQHMKWKNNHTLLAIGLTFVMTFVR